VIKTNTGRQIMSKINILNLIMWTTATTTIKTPRIHVRSHALKTALRFDRFANERCVGADTWRVSWRTRELETTSTDAGLRHRGYGVRYWLACCLTSPLGLAISGISPEREKYVMLPRPSPPFVISHRRWEKEADRSVTGACIHTAAYGQPRLP